MTSVLHSFAYGLDYLREQVADIPSADMVKQPAGMVNHPAWVIGHLVYILEMLGGVVGVAAWLPEQWAKRYGSGSVPVGDVGAYESKDRALAMLRGAQDRITLAVEQMTDLELDAPFPDPAYQNEFPTIRHALVQVLVGHTAFHVGQISVWRKGMGLGAMKRSFE